MGEVVKYKRFVITYSVRSSDDPNLLPEVQHGAFNDINEAADGLPKGTYSRKELKTLLRKYANTQDYFVIKIDEDTLLSVFIWELKNVPFTNAKAWFYGG